MTADLVANPASAHRAVGLAPAANAGPPYPPFASRVAVRELPADPLQPTPVYQDENVRVLAVLNDHSRFLPGSPAAKFCRSDAFRFEASGRIVAFTGDTGPSTRVEALARGADLPVSEVIDLTRIETILRRNPPNGVSIEALVEQLRRNHVTPTQVGQLASRAAVRAVVLHHVVPGADGETDVSGYTRGIDAHFKGPVHLARDLGRFWRSPIRGPSGRSAAGRARPDGIGGTGTNSNERPRSQVPYAAGIRVPLQSRPIP